MSIRNAIAARNKCVVVLVQTASMSSSDSVALGLKIDNESSSLCLTISGFLACGTESRQFFNSAALKPIHFSRLSQIGLTVFSESQWR